MFKIRRVEIDGFWGSFRLETDLQDDVNIFIGTNGSGKTTFINSLEAALTADLELLQSLQFSEMRLFLRDGRKHTKVTVSRIPEIVTYDKLKFKIGKNAAIELPLIPREMEYGRRRIHPRYVESLTELRSSLNELVKISWLSVHREILEDEYRDPYSRRAMPEKNPVERRIDDLTRRFTEYQVQLQSRLNKLSEDFRRDVLASMLYSETFDKFSLQDAIEPDLQALKEGLLRTYRDLGALDSRITDQIDGHVKAVATSIKAITQWVTTAKKGLKVDDVLPFPLLKRTRYILDLSTELERKKKELLSTVDIYLSALRQFARDKTFQFDPSISGQLQVSKGRTPLSLEQLSSGEKQLYILLTEALLQRGQQYIYIADEPELSLHIRWQRKVLSTLRTLNSSSQIVVATHAPEIAAGWRDKVVRMEEIIHE